MKQHARYAEEVLLGSLGEATVACQRARFTLARLMITIAAVAVSLSGFGLLRSLLDPYHDNRPRLILGHARYHEGQAEFYARRADELRNDSRAPGEFVRQYCDEFHRIAGWHSRQREKIMKEGRVVRPCPNCFFPTGSDGRLIEYLEAERRRLEDSESAQN